MKSRFRYCTTTLLCCICAVLSLGCSGGGSAGTGGLRFEGTIVSQTSQPLQGLIVTIAETGDSAVTDSSGSFAVTTEQVVGSVQLLVENGGASSSATVQEIPADASVVAVDLKLNTDTDTCDVEEVRIRHRSSTNESNGGSSGSSGSSSGNGGNSGSSGSSNGNSGSGSSGSGSSGSGGQGSSGGNSGSSGSSSGSGSSGQSGSSGGGSSESERIEVFGAISALTASSVTVTSTTFQVDAQTDFGNRHSLADFSVGEQVEARGEISGGILIAERVRLKD